MKAVFILLIGIFLVLQYKLWFADENIFQVTALRKEVATWQQKNTDLEKENAAVEADIDDLKHGSDALEERARNDLGMIKQDEIFFQVVD